VKRRQRIGRPHIRIAIRKTGAGIRTVFVICHSPARPGIQPVNGRDKRIFFHRSAMENAKKDFISILLASTAMIYHFPRRHENQHAAPLAKCAARCSYPVK
jgi:hypothetical protein